MMDVGPWIQDMLRLELPVMWKKSGSWRLPASLLAFVLTLFALSFLIVEKSGSSASIRLSQDWSDMLANAGAGGIYSLLLAAVYLVLILSVCFGRLWVGVGEKESDWLARLIDKKHRGLWGQGSSRQTRVAWTANSWKWRRHERTAVNPGNDGSVLDRLVLLKRRMSSSPNKRD
jgi:hypothetical protein